MNKTFSSLFIFLLFAASLYAQDTIKINTNLVKLNISVVDSYGRSVQGLTQENFEVYENKDKSSQKISFFNTEDVPVSIAIVLDVSGSMTKSRLKLASLAIKKFIESSHLNDEYYLIGFNNKPKLLIDRSRNESFLQEYSNLTLSGGQTALYDACYLAIHKLEKSSYKKKVVLVISDGQDNNSRYTLNDLRNLIKETGISFYCIGINSEERDYASLIKQGQDNLKEIAEIGGGEVLFPSEKTMGVAFQVIALQIRSQYEIAYYPSIPDSNKWRKVKVKLNLPKGLPQLFIKVKPGYFSIVAP